MKVGSLAANYLIGFVSHHIGDCARGVDDCSLRIENDDQKFGSVVFAIIDIELEIRCVN